MSYYESLEILGKELFDMKKELKDLKKQMAEHDFILNGEYKQKALEIVQQMEGKV